MMISAETYPKPPALMIRKHWRLMSFFTLTVWNVAKMRLLMNWIRPVYILKLSSVKYNVKWINQYALYIENQNYINLH